VRWKAFFIRRLLRHGRDVGVGALRLCRGRGVARPMLVTGLDNTRMKDDRLIGMTPSSICAGSAPLTVLIKSNCKGDMEGAIVEGDAGVAT
jgi:hypothetical protein